MARRNDTARNYNPRWERALISRTPRTCHLSSSYFNGDCFPSATLRSFEIVRPPRYSSKGNDCSFIRRINTVIVPCNSRSAELSDRIMTVQRYWRNGRIYFGQFGEFYRDCCREDPGSDYFISAGGPTRRGGGRAGNKIPGSEFRKS